MRIALLSTRLFVPALICISWATGCSSKPQDTQEKALTPLQKEIVLQCASLNDYSGIPSCTRFNEEVLEAKAEKALLEAQRAKENNPASNKEADSMSPAQNDPQNSELSLEDIRAYEDALKESERLMGIYDKQQDVRTQMFELTGDIGDWSDGMDEFVQKSNGATAYQACLKRYRAASEPYYKAETACSLERSSRYR